MINIIQPNEITLCAKILAQAFSEDSLLKWIFVTPENYTQNAPPLFASWIKYCILYGIAWRTSQFEAIALRRKPEDKKITFWKILRSGMLKTPGLIGKEAFRRLIIFEKVSEDIKNIYFKNKQYFYCWLLGTHPDYRKQGFAHLLTTETFRLANEKKLSCYLETADENAKLFHAKNGFVILTENKIPGSEIMITAMLKPH